ncbi:MAG: DUF4492 domain-containing protein [Candidatus Marinimicrobia bacterium]|jgi:hypothetical protein|nr:DUF4492 domain-containing protein [Candidatus Neomarinimicrobiota bacterium]
MINKIANFYIEGFKNLEKLGVKLWIIILIKLFIIFVVLKIFFFQNYLDKKFDNDKDKSEYIIKQLT